MLLAGWWVSYKTLKGWLAPRVLRSRYRDTSVKQLIFPSNKEEVSRALSRTLSTQDDVCFSPQNSPPLFCLNEIRSKDIGFVLGHAAAESSSSQ